jgi:hypothetical protein
MVHAPCTTEMRILHQLSNRIKFSVLHVQQDNHVLLVFRNGQACSTLLSCRVQDMLTDRGPGTKKTVSSCVCVCVGGGGGAHLQTTINLAQKKSAMITSVWVVDVGKRCQGICHGRCGIMVNPEWSTVVGNGCRKVAANACECLKGMLFH